MSRTKNTDLSKMLKIELIKNTKKPAVKWSDKKNQKTDIDLKSYNCGIITGKRNNLIVLDIDFKEDPESDGVTEFNSYLSKNPDPDTYKVKTPNGGYHYYFTYNHSDPIAYERIENELINKSGYRGSGLDIRTNGGYIVSAGSSIDKRFYSIENQKPLIEMPLSLINWLLTTPDSKKQKTKKQKIVKQDDTDHVRQSPDIDNLQYIISDAEISTMLDKLPKSYYNDYSHWFIVTTVLKGLDKFEIWDTFSKKSKKYDKMNNKKIYDSIKDFIDINLLAKVTGSAVVPFYRPYTPITNRIACEYIEISKQYLEIKDKHFNKKCVIIQSVTGTGKTTHVSSQVKRCMDEDPKLKVISIICLKTLISQHIKSFGEKDINLVSYEHKALDIDNDNIIICINSLLDIRSITDNQLQDTIIYIDEINSFLECLTHNKLLDDYLKSIFCLLMRMIKNCRKVVVSDALISDNVFNFFHRIDPRDMVYVKNNFLKYQGIKAIEVRDENLFFSRIEQETDSGKPFFFATDSCSIVTQYHDKLKETAKNPDDMILITSETKVKLTDPSKELEGKQTFTSPSTREGIDLTFKNPMPVFIYINGNSIEPSGSYQQTTRVRNIHEVYYIATDKVNKPLYSSLADVENRFKASVETSDKLLNMCTSIDNDDQLVINENTFFKLFCYNEWVKDIYNTNKRHHYKQILLNNGFSLSNVGEFKKLNEHAKEEMIEIREDNINKKFEEVKEFYKKEYETFLSPLSPDDSISIEDLNNPAKSPPTLDDKYTDFKERIELLGLAPVVHTHSDKEFNPDIFDTYKEYIISDHNLKDHLAVINLVKSDTYIDLMIKQQHGDITHKKDKGKDKGSFKVKSMTSNFAKIKLLRSFESALQISKNGLSDIDRSKYGDVIDNADELYKNFKVQFPKTTIKSALTYENISKMYVSTLTHLIGSIKLIAKTCIDAKRKTVAYDIDEDVLKFHITLNEYSNPKRKNYDPLYIDMFKD